MSKKEVENLRKKLLSKEKELRVETAKTELAKDLKYTTYTIIQDKTQKSRTFLIAKLKFDIEKGEAVLEEVRPFEDKAAGLAFVMNTDNLEFLFKKNKRRMK